jgi:hypothetical protein
MILLLIPLPNRAPSGNRRMKWFKMVMMGYQAVSQKSRETDKEKTRYVSGNVHLSNQKDVKVMIF